MNPAHRNFVARIEKVSIGVKDYQYPQKLFQVIGESLNEALAFANTVAELNQFHPRAMKLLRKRKNFIVIAEDEPISGMPMK